jgi:hypothetical protein
MKKCLCLLAVGMIIQTAAAQTTKNALLFDEFAEGKIFYLDGQIAKAPLNVDLLQNTVVMLSEGEEIFSLTDPSNVRMVALNQRFFVFKDKKLMELLEIGPINLLVQRRAELWSQKQRPPGAYGVETAAGSIQQYSGMGDYGNTTLNRSFTGGVDDVGVLRNAEVIEKNVVYLEKDGVLHPMKTLTAITSLLSVEQAKSLESFSKDHSLGCETEVDIKNLIRYTNSLIKGE